MGWVLRRLLLPFAVGSVICASLLLIWGIWSADAKAPLSPYDIAFVTLLVMPYQAVGVGLLAPMALLLCDLELPRPMYPIILGVIGSVLGLIVTLPITDRPDLPEFILPATCGALSALVWLAFNRNAITGRAWRPPGPRRNSTSQSPARWLACSRREGK